MPDFFPNRKPWIVLALVASAALFPIACCGGFLVWADGYDTIEVIDCGSQREIQISVARSWEMSQPMYYSVYVDDEVVTQRTFVGAVGYDEDPYDIRFQKFTDTSGNIVGIAFRDERDDYRIIHDFRTNHSWPSADHIPFNPKMTYSERQAIRDDSRQELAAQLPQLNDG